MDELYIEKRETRPHTVTFWHAEITAYTPAPGGGSYCHNFKCTHNHVHWRGAKACEDGMARLCRNLGVTDFGDSVSWVEKF
jgi:hypothetical protein